MDENLPSESLEQFGSMNEMILNEKVKAEAKSK